MERGRAGTDKEALVSWPLVLTILLLLWFLSLLFVILLFAIRLCRRRRKGRKNEESTHDWERRGESLPIPDDVYRRPDPCIYSQYFLMSQGMAVTWDNPDIWLQLNGTSVPSSSLQPATDYDLVARVWNNSTEAPAVDLPVRFSYLDFGIGGPPVPIGITKVDLPVKGAAGHPANAGVRWKTPPTPGHYCILVELLWGDDANPFNNLGQENTDVKALNSPKAVFTFPVWNDGRLPRTMNLEVDFYERPEAEPCPEKSARQPALTVREVEAQRRRALERHGREHFAVPEDWRILVEPKRLTLGPGEHELVTVDITAPDGFSGRQAINVNAVNGENLVGGVTLYVE